MTDRLAITGTLARPNRWFVDPGAASAGADGSCQKPFQTVEEVLALLPDPESPSAAMLDTIEICGYHKEITIDRPCILKGPAIIGTLAVENDMVGIKDLIIENISFDESDDSVLDSCLVTDTLSITDSDMVIDKCRIATLELESADANSLEIHLSTITEALTIPADYTVTVYNTVVTDVTGSYTGYNEEEITTGT